MHRSLLYALILLQVLAAAVAEALEFFGQLYDNPSLLAAAAFTTHKIQLLEAGVLIVELALCWWAHCNFQAAAAVRRQARASPRSRSRSTQPGLQLP